VHASNRDCRAGLKWGGDCFNFEHGGTRFTQWLRDHGTSPARFKRVHPEAAAKFRQPWPKPRPLNPVGIIRDVFPDNVEDYAVEIARCETGGTFNPRLVGDRTLGGSYGLYQIHWPSWGGLPWVGSRAELLEPRHNAQVALRISGGGKSWAHWTCARLIP